MNRYVIHGGRPLHGEIEISGAKNAAVAIIPAALMVDGVCRIENMPQISDVDMLLKILQGLGARVEYLSPSAVEIDCTQVRFTEPPYDLMRKIRASYYFIGSMLGRFGSAHFGFCTDLGVVTDTVRAALCGVDCAVIEANHDPELLRTGPYPVYLKRRIASDHGHLSNESAGALAVFLAENGAQQLILGHLSRENNTPRAALDTVSQALADAGFLPGEQPELYAAPADTPLVLAAGKACVCCR